MKQLLSLLSLLLILASCNQTNADATKPLTYQLVWSDEFDGTTLDETKWNYEVRGGGFGNQEKQYCTNRPKNIRLEGGNLIIEAHKEDYQGHNYTSARITSKGKGHIAYGKIEARLSLPSGKGTWPAFWMLPEKGNWPSGGELDIMEHVGKEPTMISHALHTRLRNGMNGKNWSKRFYLNDIENGFHTYGIEWINDADAGDDCITFFIDGKETVTVFQPHNTTSTDDWPFVKDFFVIFNIAMGGSWGGEIDDAIFANPIQMKVDWIRMYQKR